MLIDQEERVRFRFPLTSFLPGPLPNPGPGPGRMDANMFLPRPHVFVCLSAATFNCPSFNKSMIFVPPGTVIQGHDLFI